MGNIYRAIGVERVWLLTDGTPASPEQADAIAMGLLGGRSETREEIIWLFGPTTERHAKLAFKQWASTSPVYAQLKWEEIRFQ